VIARLSKRFLSTLTS